MTRFEWFENGHGQLALDLGFISPSMFERYIQFKIYLDYRKVGNGHIQAIQLVSEDTKASFSTVWKAVSFFIKSSDKTKV